MSEVSISEIRTDGGTQPRANLYEETVNEYTEALQGGEDFPPVVVFHDGSDYWLADGFHRFHAYRQAHAESIPAEVHQGTRREAILYSVGANSAHGLRRTNEDKRRAVETLLQDEEWGRWSDREIARQCGVSNRFVSNLRGESVTVNGSQSEPRTYTTRHGTTATMNTGNIGRRDAVSTENEPDSSTPPEIMAPEIDPAEPRPHVSNNSGNNEWYTPPEILEAARSAMGAIDFDPASSEMANKTVQAETYVTANEDGLAQEWSGRVWLNPPYSQPLIAHFCERAVNEYRNGNIDAACILTNNATETGWLQGLLREASAVCFIKGRVKYLNSEGKPENTPLQGQCVTYLGPSPGQFVSAFSDMGECWSRG